MDPITSALGLDIGGANLKAAHSQGGVVHQPFALWQNPDGLPGALAATVQQLPPADVLAVTMTGELCDCFESKRQGVQAILKAVTAAAGNMPVRVWTNDARLVESQTAHDDPLRVAAANWLALAVYAGRFFPAGPAVVIDIGSTTTDVIPLRDGTPVPRGRTDPERLRCHELIYTGVRRTPVCALLSSAGAAELFATTLDAYLVLGLLPEDAACRATADGRPATRPAAQARLARMRCADAETFSPGEAEQLAHHIHGRQVKLIRHALRQTGLVDSPVRLPGVVLAGEGEFLARAALHFAPPVRTRGIVSLAEHFGPLVSAAACAFALAHLAVETHSLRGC